MTDNLFLWKLKLKRKILHSSLSLCSETIIEQTDKSEEI